ncbi:MAG: hypothetical protein WA058_01140 [Minisyncoccia bacterium]
MNLDFWLKVVAPIITVLSLGLNFFQYFHRNKLSSFEAQRQLDRLEIEGERMRARHQQEKRDLEASYEGEVRERDRIRVDYRTAEDRRRDMVQDEEHRRQWNELFAEMIYYQRILGEEPMVLFKAESLFQKLKRKARAVWRAIVT